MSSLAQQLATIASVDAGRLSQTQRPPSFIYTPRHSASVSLVSLHSLASNAWDQLATLDPFFATYQTPILGQEAKETERTSLSKEENEKLDKVLDKVLRGLGRWMLLKPAGVVLEWLVRRFRINEFNIPALVSLFLPYHTTAFFPSALALIAPTALGPSSPFSSLLPAKNSLAPVPLAALVALLPPFSSVASSHDLLKLIIEIPLSYLPSQVPHRALVGFWLQLFVAYLDRAGSEGLDQGQQGLVLSTIIAVIQQAKGADDILVASFILLTQFGKYYPFTTEELKVVMKVVVGHRNKHVAVMGEEEGDVVAEADKERAWLTTLVLLPSLAEEDMQVKEGKKFLGGAGWKALMNVDNLDAILVELSENYNAARFLTPFLGTLALEAISSVDALDLLSSLAQTLPVALLSPLLLSTFNASLSTSPPTSLLLPVLSQLSQRHPALYANTSASLAPSEDLSQLLRQVLGGHLTEVGIDVLQTESPELVTRISALRALLSPSSNGLRAQGGNTDFVKHTLGARLAEGESDLFAVLFSNEGLTVLHETLGPSSIIDTLRVVLARPTLSKEARRAVLTYLTGPFCSKYPETRDQLVRTVVWSTLLRSKDVEIVLGSLGKEGWLAGVGQGSNEEVVARIAANMARLDATAQEDAIAFLLQDGGVLALLILGSIVPLVESGARVELVARILHAVKVERGLDLLVSSAAGSKVDAIWSVAEERKEGCEKAVRGWTVETSIAGLARVESSEWTWLAPSPVAQLAYTIYQLGHTGTTPRAKALGSKVLNSLFTTLVTSSALAFFASIFTSTSMPTELKAIALQDTSTFLTVLQTVDGGVDCQLAVPALVVALGSGEKKIRVQAMETVKVVRETMKTENANVYGRDCFYGPATSQLVQYLDTSDTLAYLDRLLTSRTEIIMDPSALSTLHSLLLDDPEALKKKKKKATLKFKAFVFLLSHAAAWVNVEARTTLLRALEGVTESAKTTLLVPLLREAINVEVAAGLFEGVDVDVTRAYCRLLLQSFAGASRKWLEAEENAALATFLDVLEVEDVTGAGAMLRQGALTIVGASLFNLVKGESKLDLLHRLARLAAVSDARLAGDVLAALRACKVDGDTVTAFLSEIRLSFSSPVSKGAKRGRTSIGNVTTRAERLPELVVLLESIDFTPIAASHALILVLFDLLSTLLDISTAAQIDIQYVGQLLLATLSKVIENVLPTSGVTSDSIRMSPVLDLMRSSVNPQTSHQALLLLAQLGPLVPDQLVHNVMPIFTFMGANVLQRDDAYSLRVVERTLESIVPALVKAIKTSSGNRDALVSDLKELLRIFTDAAAHVPRHRRIKLFVRFVETLGPREFLSAVSLLLLDKTIKATDPNSLPLAVFEHFPIDMQLSALKQIIEEIPKLILRGSGTTGEPFLDLSAVVSESSDRVTAAAKEQITNVAGFLALALEAKQLGGKIDAARASNTSNVDLTLSELVRGLLEISSLPLSASYTSSDKSDLEVLSGYSLQASVRLMSTSAFSEAVLWLLDIGDSAIEASALGLLRSRLPTIKAARRGDISPAVVNVIERLRASLADEEALETLEVIASSVYPEEDSALAKTVPDLMVVASAASVPKSTRILAMDIIKKLSYRLGPRLIPLASKLTPFAVDILRQEAQIVPLSTITSQIVISAFDILQGLFTSIPTFIGSQLDKVFDAALSIDILSLTEDKESAPAKARAHLLSTAAKKIPAKTLYPAVIRLHASLDGKAKEPILGLLDLLNRSLRQGTTGDIADNFRPIFKLFLTIFDLRRVHSSSLSHDDIDQIEENGLGAFTQFILKLNEQTFRPLFLRTYDWAVIDLADAANAEVGLIARKTVLYKLVDRLLSQLKSIVVPYFSFMLDQTIELLGSFSCSELVDSDLFTSLLDALTKSLTYDESGFWTPLRLRKLSSPIASQLSSPFSSSLLHAHLHPLLAAYSRALLPHELLLKGFNSSILMSTRSDSLSIKRASLEALEQLWDNLGDGMLLFVPETTPFLAETLEETEEGVAMVTMRLIKRIEEHLGETLDSYLEN